MLYAFTLFSHVLSHIRIALNWGTMNKKAWVLVPILTLTHTIALSKVHLPPFSESQFLSQ